MLEMAASPETLIILPFAVIIDLIGIGLVLFGLDDFWITDIIALTFLGSWSLLRSQIMPAPDVEQIQVQMPSLGEKKKTMKNIKTAKAARWAKHIKWLEFIPYVGALPLWTISVYFTIKNS